MAGQKKDMNTFDVTCGDGTSGRISAESAGKAQEMAGEMCKVHNGVTGQPAPRTEG